MKTPKFWNGESLDGYWIITRKLDGIRALRKNEGVVSRSGELLYNVELPDGIDDAEVFCGSWEKTMTALMTKNSELVSKDCIFSLENPLDDRLFIEEVFWPQAGYIKELLDEQVSIGHEGLVLRQGDNWIKVKPSETYDVRITGIIKGKGKHTGRLGAFLTELGRVGTGLTDQQREEYNDPSFIGKMMEVKATGLTKAFKFKNPRFKRIRFDK